MAPLVSRAVGPRDEHPAGRPPWAAEEAVFAALCDGCLRCAEACPEKIIVAGRGGLAEVCFSQGGCSYCGNCVAACRNGALIDRGQAPWRHKAHISSQCFSWQGVVCRRCRDQCEPVAISFRPALGGYALPEVDAAACTGCGYCVGVCPVKAVELTEAPA